MKRRSFLAALGLAPIAAVAAKAGAPTEMANEQLAKGLADANLGEATVTIRREAMSSPNGGWAMGGIDIDPRGDWGYATFFRDADGRAVLQNTTVKHIIPD